MYHGITSMPACNGIFNNSGMHVYVEHFSEQMSLLRNRYKVISLFRLVELIRNGEDIPDHSVVITFDDGYENNYNQAFPILQKYGLPATIFLSTHFMDKRDLLWGDRVEALFDSPECFARISSQLNNGIISGSSQREALESLIRYLKKIPDDQKEALIMGLEELCAIDRSQLASDYRCLTWSQVRDMCESRIMDIGSHTHSHIIMTRVDETRAREEVALSKRLLKEQAGVETRLFSYPNGAAGDYDSSTHRILQEQGFQCALLTIEGFNDKNSNLFELKRIGVPNGLSLTDFESRMSGFYIFARGLIERITRRCQ